MSFAPLSVAGLSDADARTRSFNEGQNTTVFGKRQTCVIGITLHAYWINSLVIIDHLTTKHNLILMIACSLNILLIWLWRGCTCSFNSSKYRSFAKWKYTTLICNTEKISNITVTLKRNNTRRVTRKRNCTLWTHLIRVINWLMWLLLQILHIPSRNGLYLLTNTIFT